MTDYNMTQNLFGREIMLKKFLTKRMVKIYPDNVNNYRAGSATKYNCKTVTDEWILYDQGYFVVKFTVTDTNDVGYTLNNSCYAISHALVTVQNAELDNTSNHFLTNEIQNHLEYSSNYAQMEEKFSYVSDVKPVRDEAAPHNLNGNKTTADTLREKTYVKNGNEHTIRIPLKYVSPFFRSLNFPVINNEFEFNITYDINNLIRLTAIIAGDGDNHYAQANAVTAQINETALMLPLIELRPDDEANYLKSVEEKRLTWYHFQDAHIQHYNNGVNNAQIQLAASTIGAKKVYIAVLPNDVYVNANRTHSKSNSTLPLSNLNFEIDSKLFFHHGISDDVEFYELTQECMNMQGKDPTTGSLLSFSKWNTTHKYYCFDLTRQNATFIDPLKSQTIRLITNIPAASHFFSFIVQEKTTTFNFKKPKETRTI